VSASVFVLPWGCYTVGKSKELTSKLLKGNSQKNPDTTKDRTAYIASYVAYAKAWSSYINSKSGVTATEKQQAKDLMSFGLFG